MSRWHAVQPTALPHLHHVKHTGCLEDRRTNNSMVCCLAVVDVQVFFTHLGLKDARSLRKWVTQQLQQGSRREGVQVGSTRMHMR